MRPSSYVLCVPLPETESSLLFHGYSGAVDLVSTRIAELLTGPGTSKGRLKDRLSTETLAHLAARGYVTEKSVQAEQAYVVELGRRVHEVMQRHSSPGFLVVPTYACNLRCPYCYEKGLRQKGKDWMERRMSSEMIEAAFAAMDRLAGTAKRRKALTFYGGEPLQKANEATIRLLHKRAREKGFEHFSAITNAVDLDGYEDLLGPQGKISFLQITLDGPPSVHDRRRFLPDGGGTFDRIVRNIGLAMERGVRVSVRINVDRTNAGRVAWLKQFFFEKGWTRTHLFRAYCSPVHGSVCGNRGEGGFASHAEMREAIQGEERKNEGQESPSSFQTDGLTPALQKRILAHLSQTGDLPFWRTAFCGSNMAMYLFDPFGDIYPCWEIIGRPEHRIGRYGPGLLTLDPEALRRWHHRSVVQIPACRSCPYLFFCGGGCEAFAYRATGRFDKPHCFEFQRHFQEAALGAYRAWKDRRLETTPHRGG